MYKFQYFSEIARECGVLDQCEFWNHTKGAKFNLTILYETLCPDCTLSCLIFFPPHVRLFFLPQPRINLKFPPKETHFCQNFIINSLYKRVYKKLALGKDPIVQKITFVPYGNAKRVEGEIQCQHGPEECAGSLVV